MNKKPLFVAGTLILIAVIFGVPAVLVPTAMDDVPARSKIKVITNFQEAARVVEQNFANHRGAPKPGRLAPLPTSTPDWIELINPLGRKAPGGGPWLLPAADPVTGAIGLAGDNRAVTLTVPAYRDIERREVVIRATP